MNYILRGHDHRHAVEEMLLHLLPAETPTACENDTEDCCISELMEKPGVICARAVLRFPGGDMREAICTEPAGGQDTLARRRTESELVKRSIYEVVVPMLAEAPAWGCLTGVRPAKLARSMMERSLSNAQVAQTLRDRFYVSPARAVLTVRAAAVAKHCAETLLPTDVSVYVGIPFCPSRCAYCSFVSSSIERSGALIAPYVDALCEEIRMTGALLRGAGRRIISLYIGGGTPTTLSAAQLTQLMDTLRNSMDLTALREYTVEAGRPDTITADKLRAIKNGGADRISINPQTMNDEVLAAIGRRHSADDVLRAVAQAREIGFHAINMDVIAGLAGDTPTRFIRTIEQLAALAPENITVHTLAIKKGAALSDKDENVRRGDLVEVMLDAAGERLTASGYAPYYLYRQKFTAGGFENVGWCKQSTEGLYNICMMEELQTIVSLGAGAVSKRVDPSGGRIIRYANPKYPTEYLRAGAQLEVSKRRLLGLAQAEEV